MGHTKGGRVIIGWREFVAFPDWNVTHLKAKIDTGARTSAIDVENIHDLDDGHVGFDLIVDRDRHHERIACEAPVVRRTRVKSSTGEARERVVIELRISIGPVEKVIEASLVRRHTMLCRMLIGRRALEPEFLVDCGQSYVHGRRPRRKKKRESRK